MRSYNGFFLALLVAAGSSACVDKSSLGDYEDDGGDVSDSGDGSATSGGDGDGDASGSGTGGGDNPGACALEPDSGLCDAAFTKWYFDGDEGRCRPFTYGGCDGVVPFETLADCEASCLACDAFENPPGEPSPGQVVLENRGDETIFVDAYGGGDPGCDGGYPFLLWTGDFYEPLDLIHGCRQSCSSAAELCQFPGCPAICYVAPVVRIEPGGRHTVSWSPLTYFETRLPASCAECEDVESPELECVRPEPLEGGASYAFESVAGALVCNGDDCDGCDPGPDGSCLIEHGGEVMPTTYASAQVTWDDGLTIVLVFE